MSQLHISDEDLKQAYCSRFFPKRGTALTDSDIAVNQLRTLINDPDREHFMVAFLDGSNHLINAESVSVGTITSASVYPREVVRKCLEYGSAALILAHNHPSGNLNTSRDDIALTRRIREACKLFEVSVHDHIIICRNDEYRSMADAGLI